MRAIDTVFIKADGSIEPTNATVHRDGDIYTLTGDVPRIVVEKSYMILDGNGHEVSGIFDAIYLNDVRNITIKNLNITGGEIGIYIIRCIDVVIVNNTITGVSAPIPEVQTTTAIAISGGNHTIITGNKMSENPSAIEIGNKAMNIIIFGNNITNNNYGVRLGETSNNTIQHNNFVNNSLHIEISEDSGHIFWNNQEKGNYWANYKGIDSNNDGIGDTPYVINENNQDYYPLMGPVRTIIIPEFQLWILLPLFLGITIFVNFIKKKLAYQN